MRQDRPRQPMKRGRPEPSQPAAVFPLPKDTTSAARTHGSRCQSLGLWLDRFVLYERRGNQWQQSRQSKKREGAPLNFQPLNQLLAACRRRWEAMLQSHEPNVVQFTVLPEWRIIIGLGAGHVLETSITLHRIYGVPFIPGSAVKGVTRAQAFWEITERLNVPEPLLPLLEQLLAEGDEKTQKQMWEEMRLNREFAEWQETARDFYAVFGTTERQGQVLFFDAYPTQAPRLKLDIMNPHYTPYYSDVAKRTPPADYYSPVPVYFLTVERTPFGFALASENSLLLQTAERWLKAALSNLGIGSKTAAGYGFFRLNAGNGGSAV